MKWLANVYHSCFMEYMNWSMKRERKKFSKWLRKQGYEGIDLWKEREQ